MKIVIIMIVKVFLTSTFNDFICYKQVKTREFLFVLMSCISILYEEYSITPYKNSLHSCHAKITAVFADVDHDVGSFPSTFKAVDVYYITSFPFKPDR